jgi:putative FmdB family regulatory protein
MPTYEYRCKDCHHEFDAVQSFTDDALTECPACGGALKKVFGSVGITFKGSGFYKTDSRAGASKSDGGDTSGEKSSEKVGAAKNGSDGSSNGSSGSNGKDSAASTSNDSGKSDGKSGKEKAAPAASKTASKSDSGS